MLTLLLRTLQAGSPSGVFSEFTLGDVIKGAAFLGVLLGLGWATSKLTSKADKRQRAVVSALLPKDVAERVVGTLSALEEQTPVIPDQLHNMQGRVEDVHDKLRKMDFEIKDFGTRLLTFGLTLDKFSTRMEAVPGQIAQAVVGVETRLGDRLSDMQEMQTHIVKKLDKTLNGQREQVEREVQASSERKEALRRIGHLEQQGDDAARKKSGE